MLLYNTLGLWHFIKCSCVVFEEQSISLNDLLVLVTGNKEFLDLIELDEVH